MTFRIGDTVVCINASGNCYLAEGETYTITGFGPVDDEPGVYLAERAHRSNCPFFRSRFRPVVKPKASTETGMEIMRAIRDGTLDPSSERERLKQRKVKEPS